MPIGSAEVRAVFSSGSGRVAGCMVTEGKIVQDCGIRVLRRGKKVYVGVVGSLRRVKEIVKEVIFGLFLFMFHLSLKKCECVCVLILFIICHIIHASKILPLSQTQLLIELLGFKSELYKQ